MTRRQLSGVALLFAKPTIGWIWTVARGLVDEWRMARRNGVLR